MLNTSTSKSRPRPMLAWAVNLVLLAMCYGIVFLALAETGGIWTIWTVLLSFAGISGLAVTGFLVVLWLRGHAKPPATDAVVRIDV